MNRERVEAMARTYAQWQREDARELHPFDSWRRGYRALAQLYGVSRHTARRAVILARIPPAPTPEAPPMDTETLYVIASRLRCGEHRTRYYLGMIDGRASVGDKCRAPRFTATDVATIVAQLRTLAPSRVFVIVDDSKRPPREWETSEAPKLEQLEAFAP